MRGLYENGVHAAGVRGVLPTATYPSHTSVITGAAPATHGIIANHPFGGQVEGLDVWYYYSEDLKVPTLWDAAAAAGRKVGNVSWPVSVGAAYYLAPYNQGDFQARGYLGGGFLSVVQSRLKVQQTANNVPGSWWPQWTRWLERYAGNRVAAPKKAGSRKYKRIEPAPGRYVKEKASG